MEIVIPIAAVYLLVGSLIIKVNNIQSAMVFKVAPFFMGIFLGIIALKNYSLL